MAAIGTGWADGAWIQAGWVTGAWDQTAPSAVQNYGRGLERGMTMIVAKKGEAYYLSFPAINTTTPEIYATGLSPVDTAYYKDGTGAWTSLSIADTATEIGSTGVYEIDLTAAEMNHDKIIIKFSASGMADDAYQFDLGQEHLTTPKFIALS